MSVERGHVRVEVEGLSRRELRDENRLSSFRDLRSSLRLPRVFSLGFTLGAAFSMHFNPSSLRESVPKSCSESGLQPALTLFFSACLGKQHTTSSANSLVILSLYAEAAILYRTYLVAKVCTYLDLVRSSFKCIRRLLTMIHRQRAALI